MEFAAMRAAAISKNVPSKFEAGVYRTPDVEEARLHMGRVFRSHHLHISRGAILAMQHQQLKIGGASSHWLSYGSSVTMSAPEMGRFYLFQFILQGRCEVVHGREPIVFRKGDSYAVDPNRPLSKVWSEDCQQLILRIELDRLEAFAVRETGVDTAGRLRFAFQPGPGDIQAAGILRLVDVLRADAGANDRECLTHFRVARHIESTLMSLMLVNFPHNLREEYDRAAQPCAPYYVRRAEQYMRAHAREPINLEHIVAVAGVSTRSLFAGFKRFRNITPMAYLKALRLDLAYADLIAADPTCSTVTNIAIGCGFCHMSKFARDFKARYGDAPAKILNRCNPNWR